MSKTLNITVTRVGPADVQLVGRPTALGNPFYMATEAMRDEVCDKYEAWFNDKVATKDSAVMVQLQHLWRVGKKAGALKLGCYCAPRRCHADTIAAFLRLHFDSYLENDVAMTEFKLIVAGGRDFADYHKLLRALADLTSVELADRSLSIVSGMARGADALGASFAEKHNFQLYKFYANWDAFGKSAGHIRNRQMGDFADGLLAFWDGKSVGTAGMISYMRGLNKQVTVIRYAANSK